MNCIYRSIWNDSTGTFVVVPENAKSAGKKTSSGASAKSANARFALKTLAMSMMTSFGMNVYALPVDGVVSAGNASISSSAGSTTITQTSQNVAINWPSFNIAPGEAVRFVQPNSSSVALNQVLGPDPSSILGSLAANGKVFLVNPNGILFGQGAQVNVSGLVASTLNISDSDFMADTYKFTGTGGTVLNQGAINADGGYVALLGTNVSNDGIISARLGAVALAAGNAITLDIAGDGLLNVTVNQGAVNALVQNVGLIQADGGQVLLTAQAAGNLLLSAVNNTGVIQAQTIENHNGTIKLLGDMQSGTANVGGRLDASAPNGGYGGFIETSAAHVNVAHNTIVTTESAQGRSGTWLIDPFDFTIATSGGNITPADLATALASNVIISSNDGNTGTVGDINVNNDVTWSTATTLTLNAVRNVNMNANMTTTTGSLVAIAGTDVIANAMPGTGITATGGNITWTAGRDITVNAGIVGGIAATNGNITWTAGRDINVSSAVTTTDGNFTACCGRDINIAAAMTTTRGDVLLRAGSDGTGPAGLIGGTVTFTGGHYTVTGAVGTPVAVTVDYTPTSYATPNDYSGNFTLTDAALTQHMLVFAQGNDKVYDGNTTATISFRGTPTIGGDDITLVPGVSATAIFDDKNVAPNIGITYSDYSLGGVNVGKFSLWTSCIPGPARTSATITKLNTDISGTRVYDATPVAAGADLTTISALLGGDTVTVSGTGAVANKNVGVDKNVTSMGTLALAGADAGNYNLVSGALTITKLNTDISGTRVYNATPVAAGADLTTISALLSGDTVTVSGTGAVANKNVGVDKNVTSMGTLALAGADAGNYNLVSGALTVIPLALTGSITAANKVYDTTTAAAITGRTLAGVLSPDDVAYTGGTATFDTPAVGIGKTVTGTGLGLFGADAGNYTVNSIAATTANITSVVPVVEPPVIVLPVETTPGATSPAAGEMLGEEQNIEQAPRLGVVPSRLTSVVMADTPAQLRTVVLPGVAPVIVPPVQPAPVVAPVESQPQLYVAPYRARKQDRY